MPDADTLPLYTAGVMLVCIALLLHDPGVRDHLDLVTCTPPESAASAGTHAAANTSHTSLVASQAAHRGAHSCQVGFEQRWTSVCQPVFGVDEARVARTSSPCESFHAYACGGYDDDYPAPSAFTRMNAVTDELEKAMRRTLGAWEDSTWRQLASACTSARDNAATGATTFAGAAESSAAVRSAILSARRAFETGGAAAALGVALAHDAPVMLYAEPRAFPTDRARVVLHLTLRKPETVDTPALFPHLNSPVDVADAAAWKARAAAAVSRLEALVWRTFVALARTPKPSTLHAYSLASGISSLAADSHPSIVEELQPLLHTLRSAQPLAAPFAAAGVWCLHSAAVLALLRELATASAEDVLLYVETMLLRRYAWGLGSQHDTAAVSPAAHHGSRTPPVWTDATSFLSGCHTFASRNAWWKEGQWMAQAVATERRENGIRDVFEEVRDAIVRRLQRTSWLRDSPTLRRRLVHKLRHVLLRIEGQDVVGPLANSSTDSTARLQQLCAAARWTTLAPRACNTTGRVLEATQFTGNGANAFYNALDNTVTVFPAMLGGQFYAGNAAAAMLGQKHAHDARLATLGFVLAHELSHAYDTAGIFYAANGTVRESAPRPEMKAFLSRASCLVESFGRRGIDGYATLNENLADAFAYKTITHILRHRNANLSAFFIAQAQLWCGTDNMDDGVHAPSRERVDVGGLVVQDVRASTFRCTGRPAVAVCEGL